MTNFISKNIAIEHNWGSSRVGVEDEPLVAILMCTYHGEQFLVEQLNSLEEQTHRNWVLVVSDDGSNDATLDILRQYQAKWPQGKMTIRNGPKQGYCNNFLSLACDPQIQALYFAFCDQDDVWLPEKLTVALKIIVATQNIHIPFLYCGRTRYVTERLQSCGTSPLFVFPPSFRNALVQSIAGGNTMVFNLAAKLLIEKAGLVDVPSHDWWLYLLISGAQGDVFYDPVPHLLYRQHDGALVGGSNSFRAKTERMVMIWQGRFRVWNAQNVAALTGVSYLLVKNHQDILRMFALLREARLKDRIRLIEVCGLYRQTRRGTFSLFLAILLNRV